MYEEDWTPAALKKQFIAAKEHGWLPFFQSAAKQYNLPVEILLGIASRETNIKNIIGDKGNAFGIMQIDKRYYPEWCASGKWRNPEEAIRMGAFVLRGFLESAYRWLQGEKYDKMRGALAAYNAGKRAFMHYFSNGDPDTATTGNNYSKDVLARSKVFATLIGDANKA